MTCRTLLIVFTIYFLIAPLGIAQTLKTSTQTTPTAEEILAQMSKIYAGCKTYQDHGIVTIKIIRSNDEMIMERPFTTAFIRPSRFRYEYKEKKPYSNKEYRYIIWSGGQEVKSWWDINPGIQKKQSLSMALAGATGVSGGSAHTIPALLLPEVGGCPLTDIRDAKRIDDAIVDNANCFRIEGKYCGESSIIWIDAKSFLVRFITTEHKFPEFRSETKTSYSPIVDGPISEKALEFDPPAELK